MPRPLGHRTKTSEAWAEDFTRTHYLMKKLAKLWSLVKVVTYHHSWPSKSKSTPTLVLCRMEVEQWEQRRMAGF